MVVTFCAPRLVGHRCYVAGDSADVPEVRAKRLIAAGAAVATDGGDAPPADPADEHPPAPAPDADSFEALGVTPKAAKLLRAAGFETPASVRAAGDAELVSINGLGKASVAAIRALLPADVAPAA